MTRAIPLIYNPASGGGRGRVRYRKAEAMLAVAGLDVDAIETEAPNHATALAKDLADAGHEKVFAFGGDGTMSEVANGLLQSSQRPAMGMIPSGTGNDFLRHFGVRSVDEALERIRHGTARAIDAVRVEAGGHTSWSINLVGVGFAPRSVIATNSRYKWAGPQAYNLGVIDQIIRLKPVTTRLTIDGHTRTGSFPLVLGMTTTYTGGAMKMAPDADPQDGFMDLMWVDPISRLELLRLLGGIRKATHVGHPKVHFQRAKKVHIEPADPSPLLIDGEVYGETPVTLTVEPKALRVLL